MATARTYTLVLNRILTTLVLYARMDGDDIKLWADEPAAPRSHGTVPQRVAERDVAGSVDWVCSILECYLISRPAR